MAVSAFLVQGLHTGADAEKEVQRRHFVPGRPGMRRRSHTVLMTGRQERISPIDNVPQGLRTVGKEHVTAVFLNGHSQERHEIGMLAAAVNCCFVPAGLDEFGVGTDDAFQRILGHPTVALTVVHGRDCLEYVTEAAFGNLAAHHHAFARVERNDGSSSLAEELLDPVPNVTQEAHQCMNHGGGGFGEGGAKTRYGGIE